jgi:hypothetical protein
MLFHSMQYGRVITTQKSTNLRQCHTGLAQYPHALMPRRNNMAPPVPTGNILVRQLMPLQNRLHKIP